MLLLFKINFFKRYSVSQTICKGYRRREMWPLASKVNQILPISFCPPNVICLLLVSYLLMLQTTFIMEANCMKPDQIAQGSLIWVHNVCNIGCQITSADDNCCDYSKTCLKRPLKNRQNKGFNGKWWLYEGGKYCRMIPLAHSAILLTCIKR